MSVAKASCCSCAGRWPRARRRCLARWQRGISSDDPDGYRSGHILGAVFDAMVSELSDPWHPVPDMLAPPEQFEAAMQRLGIGDDTWVVAYDNMGVPLGSARLWWALPYYGHDRVRVLDGGLKQGCAEGRPLSTDWVAPEPAPFKAQPRRGWLADRLLHPGVQQGRVNEARSCRSCRPS